MSIFRSHRPIRVEQLDQKDEEDGLTEKFVQRNDGFRMDREKEPRFAQPGSFEFEFGMKHRRIDEMEREGIERVKQEMEMERKRLGEEMETAAFDYQAEQIRQGANTVKPVSNGHSKIDKTKILMTNGSSMKVKSIAEYSPWSILQYFCPALSNNWS